MKKYFVVSDVHSFYDEMMEALNSKGFDINNPDHILVSLGDLFDRGPKTKEVMNFVLSLPEERTILIFGNHELLMEDMLQRGCLQPYDKTNGTWRTAKDLTGGWSNEQIFDLMVSNQQWKEYRRRCQLFAEVGDNIFVHGWIPCFDYDKFGCSLYHIYNPNWRDASVRDWKDATWLNGMACWAEGIIEPDKTIWCGHWHTSYGHCHLHGDGVEFLDEASELEIEMCGNYEKFDPFIDENICAMDACTAHTHKVNCLTFEY